MIISAYFTTGKSTLALKDNSIIDLDSKPFRDLKQIHKEWWKIYCDIALELEKQNHIVLMWSNNKNIHKYLKERSKSYHIIMYDLHLKDYVINKALERDKTSFRPNTTYAITNKFDKSFNDVLQVSNEYNIDLYLIRDENYNLIDIIEEISNKRTDNNGRI